MTEVDAQDTAPLELFANERRRRVVQCLSGRETGLALADLATDVAALEADADPRDVPTEEAERVSLSLYHCHVPKLAAHGFVDYDADRKVVSLANESELRGTIGRGVGEVPVRRRA